MNEKVSLIIPVFNGEKFLPDLYKTLSQITYEHTEIVFVDNNSTDSSYSKLEILAEKLKKFDVILEKEKLPGASHARNKGVKVSTGQYLSFLDCDDSFVPNKIEKDLSILLKENVDFVFSRGFRKYEDGRTLYHPIDGINIGLTNPPNLGLIWMNNFFSIQHFGGLLLRKTVFEEVGGFPDTKTGEDAIFMIKLGLTKIGYFNDEVLYTYFRHSNSTISQASKNGNREIDYFNQRLLMWNSPIITSNLKARRLLNFQINLDILKHSKTYKRELIAIAKKSKFNSNFLINNQLSFFLQDKLGTFKNPFFWLLKFIYNL